MMIETLTRREQQVADAVARGLTNRQIAAEFGISSETVKQHLSSIYGKLGMSGRVMLAIYVIRSAGAPAGHAADYALSGLRPAN
ncbi:MAG TPA: helix-turn-helix transcriptional regulator [Vicinamibacterales bacterium]|nr:helix-turn-helix transcriptional regulator [Vicinamibacterales bacterium]